MTYQNRTPAVPLLTDGHGNVLNEPYYQNEFEFMDAINEYIRELSDLKEDFERRFEVEDNILNLIEYGGVSTVLFNITRRIHDINHQAGFLRPMNRRAEGIAHDYLEMIKVMMVDMAASSSKDSVIVRYKVNEIIQDLNIKDQQLAEEKLDNIMAIFRDDIDKRIKSLEMILIQIELLRRTLSLDINIRSSNVIT